MAGDYVAYATGSDHDTSITWAQDVATLSGGCNDDADDSYDAADNTFAFAQSEQEYVQVGTYSDNETGTGGIGVTRVVPAADDFAAATDLTFRPGAATAVIGIGLAGTEGLETGEPTACGSATMATDSAWLDFVAPESGSWMIETKSTDTVDLAVYQGSSPAALTLKNCAAEQPDYTNRKAVLVDLAAGSTYRIRVGGAGATEPVVVRAERVRVPMATTRVDTDGDGTSTDVGSESDLAVVDGRPAIAYYDGDNGELRYAAQAANGTWSDVLVDADGDGTSTDVGRNPSIGVLPNGQPAIAYHDEQNGELRYATRTGGVWSDELVDADGDGSSTDVGGDNDLLVLANSRPAIAYHDATADTLRFAVRVNGVWNEVLVDADGDGTSTSLGRYVYLAQRPNGDLAIAYGDASEETVRMASRVGGVWSDALVYDHPLGNSLLPAGIVVDSTGAPVVGILDSYTANHAVALWNGASWSVDWDHADRHVAELDWNCTAPELLIDDADTTYLLWSDCNFAGTFAASVRDAAGNWEIRDLFAKLYSPASAGYTGALVAWDSWRFGAAWLPDGRMAVSLQNAGDHSLWYGRDALVAEAGPAAGGPAKTVATLDGSASRDSWGSIVSSAWTGAPAGCTVADPMARKTTISCADSTSGTMTLTVTDTDGFTHADTTPFEVLGTVGEDPLCDTSPDPFVDVPATSFARADIRCIYHLGVTTGTSPTTYSPAADVTREQMASFLARLYKVMTGTNAPVAAHPFTDVPTGSFARDDIGRIYGLGITTGTTPTTYSPNDPVTREQMASFLARLYKA
ncbi:MAG: S-layer homology domain-containing protein, partial [Acidimicrobiales bacterium]